MRVRVLPVALIAVAALLGGCAATPVSTPTSPEVSVAAPTDVPGSTLDADAVTEAAPEGQRISVVIAADAGEPERSALSLVEAFVAAHDGIVTVHADAAPVDSVSAALAQHPDVIVALGPSVVGAIDLASASNLDQSFLVLGTQLAEPTGNVVAVVWPGADERAVFAEEKPSFSGVDAYAATAVDLGLSAFPSGLSGHVIALD